MWCWSVRFAIQSSIVRKVFSGVLRRGEIGKGCDCNTCRGNPRLNMFGTSPHTNYCNYCTRNSRKNAIFSQPLQTLVSHELWHELLRQKTTMAATPLAESTSSPHIVLERYTNFSNFFPEFCPEVCSEVSPDFSRTFVFYFLGDGGH